MGCGLPLFVMAAPFSACSLQEGSWSKDLGARPGGGDPVLQPSSLSSADLLWSRSLCLLPDKGAGGIHHPETPNMSLSRSRCCGDAASLQGGQEAGEGCDPLRGMETIQGI